MCVICVCVCVCVCYYVTMCDVFLFLKKISAFPTLWPRHPAQALSFIADVRDRLLEPDATIIPAAGCQFISCIESPDIKSITSVSGWDGIKLDGFEVSHTTTKKTKFPTTTPPPPPPVFIQREGPWCGAMMMGCVPSPSRLRLPTAPFRGLVPALCDPPSLCADVCTRHHRYDSSLWLYHPCQALKDTVTVVFTKQYGFRLSSIPFKTIVPRISVADIDFYTDGQ